MIYCPIFQIKVFSLDNNDDDDGDSDDDDDELNLMAYKTVLIVFCLNLGVRIVHL